MPAADPSTSSGQAWGTRCVFKPLGVTTLVTSGWLWTLRDFRAKARTLAAATPTPFRLGY
jgi:hypothetical protein